MKQLARILVIFTLLISCKAKEKSTINQVSIASKHTINSTVLNEERTLFISLPDGYEKSNGTYPVLILTDGKQNIKHVAGSIELLTRTGSIPPIIVVGIESINRSKDFSPSQVKNRPDTGNAPKFLDFIENEVFPYVDSNFRTHPFRILQGHSLGGLFTAYTLMEKPGLFDAHIILSPSFWWNQEEIIKKSGKFFKENQTLNKAIYFSIGKDESHSDWGMRKELSKFVDSLKANKPKNLRFKHIELDNEGHMSSPLLGNYHGLRWVFSDMFFSEEQIKNYSNKLFLDHEDMIKNKYGNQAKQSAEMYVYISNYLRSKKNFKGAITVLKRSIEVYDYDISLKYNLARTYELNNQIDEAIDIYKEGIKTSRKYKFSHEKRLQKEIHRLEKIE